jgi:putative membrane protein
MNTRTYRFLVRWAVSVIGLWLASELLGAESINIDGGFIAFAISGLLLAIVNTIIRPLVVFMTLPAVLLTLGIFMLVINALMVQLAAWLYGPFFVSGFGIAVITGMVIGIVNWLISALLEDNKK